MGEIQVNFESLEEGRAQLSAIYGRLTATLDELNTALAAMLETWSGAAQDAYLACKTDWDNAAAELAVTLQIVGNSVESAHGNYLATHDATKQVWV